MYNPTGRKDHFDGPVRVFVRHRRITPHSVGCSPGSFMRAASYPSPFAWLSGMMIGPVVFDLLELSDLRNVKRTDKLEIPRRFFPEANPPLGSHLTEPSDSHLSCMKATRSRRPLGSLALALTFITVL